MNTSSCKFSLQNHPLLWDRGGRGTCAFGSRLYDWCFVHLTPIGLHALFHYLRRRLRALRCVFVDQRSGWWSAISTLRATAALGSVERAEACWGPISWGRCADLRYVGEKQRLQQVVRQGRLGATFLTAATSQLVPPAATQRCGTIVYHTEQQHLPLG